jgi:hypothetical protein
VPVQSVRAHRWHYLVLYVVLTLFFLYPQVSCFWPSLFQGQALFVSLLMQQPPQQRVRTLPMQQLACVANKCAEPPPESTMAPPCTGVQGDSEHAVMSPSG